MKLTFLGTGAGEGYPGYWCECPHCTYARKHRGKNLRTNSSMVIDEELLIDIGPSCFDNAARFGVNLSKIKTLFWSHILMKIICNRSICTGEIRMKACCRLLMSKR